LFGTPWISDYVIRIEPRIREVHIALQTDRDIYVPLLESSKPSLVRVASPCVLHPFTETLLSVHTDRSGVSRIRAPQHRHDVTAQLKNGLIELLSPGSKFDCWVANFSSRPVALKSGQVVWVADAQMVSHVLTVPAEQSNLNSSEECERIVRIQATHLSGLEMEKLLASLRPHASLWDGHLGNIDAVQHHIPTTGPPVETQPYSVGPAARASIDAELQRMKEMDVVEPAEGPWASPVVLIPKPDGSVRFCVDYRLLNALTTKDSYALLRVDDSLDSLGGAQYFSTLDANSGYWKISVNPTDRDKTMFTTHRGLCRFKRLPFGLVSAPATFQREIYVILSSVRFRCALTYLDDIIVFSSTFEQHIRDLNLALSLVRSAGVTLKLDKCLFLRRKFRIWDILWAVKDYVWMNRRFLRYKARYPRKLRQGSEYS
jgi:Reverse transcriptase (RNA-dependent DNA polymerase)